MNVIKLLSCRWKYPMPRRNPFNNAPDYRVINYFIQYERVNHIVNAVADDTGYIYKHEDEIDLEIREKLFQALPHEEVNELHIRMSEGCLWPDYEERERALNSNRAIGRDFRTLAINTQTIARVVNLSTRIQFFDMADDYVRNAILPTIPLCLNLELPDGIPSLLAPPFMDRADVDRVLDRNNGYNLMY